MIVTAHFILSAGSPNIIGLSATMFTLAVFYFQLVALAKDDFVFEVSLTGSEVSLHSLLTSNSMMLAMFL